MLLLHVDYAEAANTKKSFCHNCTLLLYSTTWHEGYKSTNEVEQQQQKGHWQQEGKIMILMKAAVKSEEEEQRGITPNVLAMANGSQ